MPLFFFIDIDEESGSVGYSHGKFIIILLYAKIGMNNTKIENDGPFHFEVLGTSSIRRRSIYYMVHFKP